MTEADQQMPRPGRRALRAVRLSKFRGEEDPTTSPRRQLATVDKSIAANDLDVVGTATDLDESAYKMSPFARPELGEWLNYRINEFDIIVWASLDRAVRRMSDMSELAKWARANRKKLIFCSGPGGSLEIDFMQQSPLAELMAQVLAFAAEMEAYNDRERTINTQAYLRQVSRYAGGWIPFGWCPISLGKGNGFALEPDPEYQPWLIKMVDSALAGKGPTAIASWLHAEGIPTSKDILRIRQGKKPLGLEWRYPAVIGILRSRAMCGITELDGKVVYGDDGMPVRFAEPIIDDATWGRLQIALDKLSRSVNRRREDSPWPVGVAFCRCGLPLHVKRQMKDGKLYEYMRCDAKRERRECNAPEIRLDRLEAEIETRVLQADWSGRPYMEIRTVEGINHAPEMATVKAAIKDFAGNAAVKEALGESSEEERAKLVILKSRLANLIRMTADEGSQRERVIWVQTGETVAQHWAKLNGDGRNAMLRSHQAKVIAYRTGKDLTVEIEPGTLANVPMYRQISQN